MKTVHINLPKLATFEITAEMVDRDWCFQIARSLPCSLDTISEVLATLKGNKELTEEWCGVCARVGVNPSAALAPIRRKQVATSNAEELQRLADVVAKL